MQAILTSKVKYYCYEDSHSDRHEVISHCGFDFHHPGDWWCSASFHVPVSPWMLSLNTVSAIAWCLLNKEVLLLTASLALLQWVWYIRRMHGIIMTTNYDHTYNDSAQYLVYGRCPNIFSHIPTSISSFSKTVVSVEAIYSLGISSLIKWASLLAQQ